MASRSFQLVRFHAGRIQNPDQPHLVKQQVEPASRARVQHVFAGVEVPPTPQRAEVPRRLIHPEQQVRLIRRRRIDRGDVECGMAHGCGHKRHPAALLPLAIKRQ